MHNQMEINEKQFSQITLKEENLTVTIKKGIHASLVMQYEQHINERDVNFVLEEGSSLTLLMANNLNEACNVKQVIDMFKDATLKLAYWELNEGASNIKTIVNLNESGANAYV